MSRFRSVGAARAIALAGLTVSMLAPSPAEAADKPAAPAKGVQLAEDMFKASADAYRRGDFKTAIELLNRVYAADPEPSILYNLGRAYEGLGDLHAAVDHYKRFLAQDPHARDRGALEQRITTLERQIAERDALARQRDEERARAEQQAKEREATEAELARARQNQGRAEEPPRKRSAIPYIIGGIGIAGLATGTAFALIGSSTHNEAMGERQQQRAADLDATAGDQATIANIGFIAGGILLATGATWWVLEGRSKRTGAATSVRVGVGPGFGFIGGVLP